MKPWSSSGAVVTIEQLTQFQIKTINGRLDALEKAATPPPRKAATLPRRKARR